MNIILPKKTNLLFDRNPNLVLGLILFSVLMTIRLISGFNGLYGQDSYEYLRYSRQLTCFFTKGISPGDYFWPVNFPLLGAVLSLIIKSNIFSLQLISMLSFVFAAFYTFKLINLFYPDYGRESYLYLTLFLCISPYFFRSAFLIMSDMLAVFLTIGAVFHIFQYHVKFRRADFLLGIFFATTAIMTRYAAGVLLIYPVFLLGIGSFRRFRFSDLIWGVVILLLGLGPHILIKGTNAGAFLGHKWLSYWSLKNWFLSEFNTQDGYHNYRFPNIIYSLSNYFYPGFLFPGAVLIFFITKKQFKSKAFMRMVLMTLLFALFVAGFPTQNMRFLLLSFPLAITLVFPLFRRFRQRLPSNRLYPISLSIIVVLIQVTLIYKYSSGIYRDNQIEKEVAETVLKYSDRPIYTFAIDGALRCYGVDSDDVVNLWYDKLNIVKTHALVLFNESRFKHQWKGRNPMINWQFIQTNYTLQKIETLPEGWELYQVKGKAF
jgi:hypothetical protein